MSKTQLQANNTRLASLIDTLKGKAAGGGSSGGGSGSTETCNVTVTWSKSPSGVDQYQSADFPCVAYINGNGELATVTGTMSFPMKNSWTATIECMCGSLLVFSQGYVSNNGLSYTTSEEIVMSAALPTNSITDVVCVLPHSAGNYTIDILYN